MKMLRATQAQCGAIAALAVLALAVAPTRAPAQNLCGRCSGKGMNPPKVDRPIDARYDWFQKDKKDNYFQEIRITFFADSTYIYDSIQRQKFQSGTQRWWTRQSGRWVRGSMALLVCLRPDSLPGVMSCYGLGERPPLEADIAKHPGKSVFEVPRSWGRELYLYGPPNGVALPTSVDTLKLSDEGS